MPRFLTLVWPYDTQRRLIWETGASDIWFWIHVAQAIIFTVLVILAFRQLARVTKDAGTVAGTFPLPVAADGSDG